MYVLFEYIAKQEYNWYLFLFFFIIIYVRIFYFSKLFHQKKKKIENVINIIEKRDKDRYREQEEIVENEKTKFSIRIVNILFW